MIGEGFKEEAVEAFKKYVGKDEKTNINDDSADPPKDAASLALKTGIKAFLHDFGLDKSMNPLTLLKIYGDVEN